MWPRYLINLKIRYNEILEKKIYIYTYLMHKMANININMRSETADRSWVYASGMTRGG